jgi:hypothetical protein
MDPGSIMNIHDAPPGFQAVLAKHLCGGCAFHKWCRRSAEDPPNVVLNCVPSLRRDGQLVVFKALKR